NVPFFKEQHDAHHAAPNAFIGAPPVLGIVMIFCLSYLPFVSVSVMAASGLTIGMLTGYLAYMLLHHAAHHWNVAPESWLYRLRRHHALHHHSRIDGNYGITTSFWDIVFGTSLAPRRTRFRFKLR
ncbi:MAG: sterol desaturase family protein, partial [Hyphomicrobium sp.]